MNGRGCLECNISPIVEMTNACHSEQREESYQVAEDKISPTVEMTNACHSDQREESYQVAEDKISPTVEMTNACHSDQRDDCMDAEGRAMQGAIAEESYLTTRLFKSTPLPGLPKNMTAIQSTKTTQRKKQRAFILLPVILTLTILAAVAYLLNREGSINAGNVNREHEQDAALYVAQAGYNHAVWQLNRKNCTGYSDIPDTSIGSHSYLAAFTDTTGTALTTGSPANIKVVGSLTNGTKYTIDRDQVKIYQFPTQQVVLQPDESSGKDTYLYMWKSTWNYGLSTTLWVSNKWADSLANSLLNFDVSVIPSEAKIISAKLELWQNIPSANGGTVTVRRILSDWIEGTKTGGIGTASWNDRDSGNSWANAGGDYSSIVYASTIIPASTVSWFQWDITNLVAGWVSGEASNQGFILTPESVNTHVEFNSSDSTDPTLRPKLTISYACECGVVCGTAGDLLFVSAGTVGPIIPTVQEQLRIDLIESWNYNVSLIHQTASQAEFDTAVEANNVAYVSAEIDDTVLDVKLRNATIGVINEEVDAAAEFGFAADRLFKTDSEINIIDNSHYITSPFATGLLTILSSSQPIHTLNATYSTDLNTLGETFNTGSNYKPSLAVLDSGDIMESGGNTPARRVQLPWGQDSFDFNALNGDGQTIMKRAIEWGAELVAATGPIAHWKLDETSGTTAVDSAGGNDGTLTNGPAWAVGQVDGALSFDGTNDFIDVAHEAALSLNQQMTFTAWVNATSFGSGYQAIIAKDIPGNGKSNYWFGSWQGDLVFGFWADGAFRTVQSSGLNLQTGTWYHLTASFDNATDQVLLYLDGSQVQAGSISFEPFPETANLWIGHSVDGEYWPGKLDDVRVYDRLLTATEITDLYTAGNVIVGTLLELSPFQDTQIRANTTFSYGSKTDMALTLGSPEIRPLLQFDTSSLTPGSTVISAKLRLYQSTVITGGSMSANAYRVTEEWDDAWGGSGGANWTNRFKQGGSTLLWATEGVSYDGGWQSQTTFDAAINNQWVEWDLTPLVQEWVDGISSNYGVVIIPVSSGPYAIFSSSNSGDSAFYPQLVIEYTTP